jgi:hypothetical protein
MPVSINKDLGFRRDGSNNHFYRKDLGQEKTVRWFFCYLKIVSFNDREWR